MRRALSPLYRLFFLWERPWDLTSLSEADSTPTHAGGRTQVLRLIVGPLGGRWGIPIGEDWCVIGV